MTENEFKKELNALETQGWEYRGDISCPEVGGDHDCEIWVNPSDDTKTAEVCRICAYVNYK